MSSLAAAQPEHSPTNPAFSKEGSATGRCGGGRVSDQKAEDKKSCTRIRIAQIFAAALMGLALAGTSVASITFGVTPLGVGLAIVGGVIAIASLVHLLAFIKIGIEAKASSR